jgi:hypothetical protein
MFGARLTASPQKNPAAMRGFFLPGDRPLLAFGRLMCSALPGTIDGPNGEKGWRRD